MAGQNSSSNLRTLLGGYASDDGSSGSQDDEPMLGAANPLGLGAGPLPAASPERDADASPPSSQPAPPGASPLRLAPAPSQGGAVEPGDAGDAGPTAMETDGPDGGAPGEAGSAEPIDPLSRLPQHLRQPPEEECDPDVQVWRARGCCRCSRVYQSLSGLVAV